MADTQDKNQPQPSSGQSQIGEDLKTRHETSFNKTLPEDEQAGDIENPGHRQAS